jgi:hypothetical protein
MKLISPVLTFLTLWFIIILAAGCGSPDDGFRFDGEYSADRSGFAVRMLSEGYAPDGSVADGEAFAIVQFCPSGGAEGRPVRMTLTAARGGRTKVECGELGPDPMDWTAQNSEGLLRGALTSAGFRQIDPSELGGCLGAIDRAIGAKSREQAVPPDHALRVIGEDFTEGHEIDHDIPPAEWVAQSEVAGCR